MKFMRHATSSGQAIFRPVRSSITLTNPSSSPGNLSQPSFLVSGVASGDLVALYPNSSCSGNSLGSATASGSSVPIGVDSSTPLVDGTYQFYAKSQDPSGNLSNCSSAFASYRFDGTPPAAATNLHFGPWTNLEQSPPLLDVDWSASLSGDLASHTLQIFYNESCSGTPEETWAAQVPFLYAGMMIGARPGKTESFNIRSVDQVGNFSISECSPSIQVGIPQGTLTQELVIPETESGALSTLLENPGWRLHFSVPVEISSLTEDLFSNRMEGTATPAVPASSSSGAPRYPSAPASGIRYRILPRGEDQGFAQDFDITVVAVTRPGRIAPYFDASALTNDQGIFTGLTLDGFTYEGAPVQTLHEGPHRYSCDCSDPHRNQNLAKEKFTDRIAGSSLLPFEVCTREDLQGIQELVQQAETAGTLNPRFVQCRDLDFEGIAFQPIGDSDAPFSGTYDGNGFSILNLSIHPESGVKLGLFSTLNQATIENLSILGADIGNSVPGANCGILAGVSLDSTVEKVATEGAVQCLNGSVGGLIGAVQNHEPSLFKEISSAGSVRGEEDSSAGGLFGRTCRLNLMQSFATASVRSGHLEAGGLVGVLGCNENTIERSYATGSVQAETMAGGLIGRSEDQVRVRDSVYLSGGIHGGDHAGGIVGWSDRTDLTLTHVYAAPIALDPQSTSGSIRPIDIENPGPDTRTHPILGNYGGFSAQLGSLHFTGVAHWSSGANLNGDAPQYQEGSYPGSWTLTENAAFQSMSFDQLSDSALLSGLGYDFHSAWESTIAPGIPLPRTSDASSVLVNLPHRIACEETCNPSALNFVDAGPGSDGSPEHPYMVCSERQLLGLSEVDWRSRIGENFVQCRDLDLKGMRPSPIGSINAPFQGVYDGNGYRISNLEIRDSSHQNLGLFGFLKNARIQNIILERARIIGNSVAGVLFGHSDSSTLENVHVQNGSIVQVQRWSVGMIGGKASSTSITLASADGEVSGSEAAGGLIGFAQALRIDRSLASAQVYASQTGAGGLVGAWEGAGSVTRSYANGSVLSDRGRAGGLIGDARAVNETLVIRNSAYLNHSVTSGGGSAGGLIGNGDRGLDLGNSYSAAISVSGVNPDSTHPIIGNYRDFSNLNSYPSFSSVEYWSEGANPEGSLPHYPKSQYASLSEAPFSADSFGVLSNESMMSRKGFDFDTTWAMDPGLRLPLPLIDFTTPDAPAPKNVLHPFACACDPDYPGGSPMADGSSLRPYQVCSPNHLGFLARNYNKNFVQCQNLDLRNRSHRPIPVFKGHFDGNGYEIQNLLLTDFTPDATHEDQVNLGFFGSLDAGARVENLTLTSVTLPDPSSHGLNAGYIVGALAGRLNGGSQILNSKVQLSSFTGTASAAAGGVVGLVKDSTLQNIEVSGAPVTGGSNLGGIAGGCTNCTMKNLLVRVDVQGQDQVGGIAGLMEGTTLLLDSVVEGRIRGEHAVGGLVGALNEGSADIERCSFRGRSVRGRIFVGGLIGRLNQPLTLKDTDSLALEIHGDASTNPIIGNYESAKASGYLAKIENVRFWESGADPNGSSPTVTDAYAFHPDSGVTGSTYSTLFEGGLTGVLASAGSKGLPGSNLLPYLPPIPTPSPLATKPTKHDDFIPRTLHTQTTLTDSRGKTLILVVGGYDDGNPDLILNSAQLYDPDTKTWRDTAPLTLPRYGHAASLLPDGSVMVYGGIAPDGSPTDTEIYSLADESWTPGPTMGTPHGFGFSDVGIDATSEDTSLPLHQGGIFVAGGAGEQGFNDSMEVFSFEDRAWHDFGKLRTPRARAASVALPGSRVLIAGGESADEKSIGVWSSSELIDFNHPGVTTPASTLLQPRTHASAIHWTPADGSTLSPMTFLFGGYDREMNTISSIEYLEDDQVTSSESWHWASVSLPIPAADVSLFNLPDHTILILGGSDFSPLSQALVFNPELLLNPSLDHPASSLVAIDPMPLGLDHPAASLLQDGSLFFTGGSGSSNDRGSAFTGTFTPSKPNWIVPPSSNSNRTPGSLPSPTPRAGGYRELHTFRAVKSFGAPSALIEIQDGVFVGTTTSGGSTGRGSLYRVNSDGSGYSVLHDFQGPEGSAPMGRIALLHGKIYGVTTSGGDQNSGTLYEFDLTSSDLHAVQSFEPDTRPSGLTSAGEQIYGVFQQNPNPGIFTYDPGSPSLGVTTFYSFSSEDCSSPQELAAGDGSLFGFCTGGGPSGGGIAFRLGLSDSKFEILHQFGDAGNGSGAQPISAPLIAGDTLFGIVGSSVAEINSPGIFKMALTGEHSLSFLWRRAKDSDIEFPVALASNGAGGVLATLISGGGPDGSGGVLSVNPDGESGLHPFASDQNIANPVSPVIVSRGSWFGTFIRGVNETAPGTRGGIFRMDPNGSASRILSFIPENKGSRTDGAPVRLGTKLYGVTGIGGAGQGGTLYSIDPDSGTTSTLYEFGWGADAGANPSGGLIAYQNRLYGLTTSCGGGALVGGGCAGAGTLYSYDPENDSITTLVHFSEGIGLSNPRGSLTLMNQSLYGVTLSGGDFNHGAIFEFDLRGGRLSRIASVPEDSSTPEGGLANDGTSLFGVMGAGGKSGNGYLYQLAPSDERGSWTLLGLHAFLEDANVSIGGNLLYHSGSLIGTTMGNGSGLRGTLYKFDLGSGVFRVLHRFLGGREDLGAPLPGIVQSGNILFGMTLPYDDDRTHPDRGPALYRFDTNTLVLQILHSWRGETAREEWGQPGSSLTLLGSTLFGTRSDGFGLDHFYSIDTGLQSTPVTSALFASPAITTPGGGVDPGALQIQGNSLAADFKGDGKMGLATAFFTDVLLNPVSASGVLEQGSLLAARVRTATSAIAAGSVFPGLPPSLAVSKPDLNSVTLYKNDGTGSLTEYGTFAVGQKPVNLVIADLRKNEKPDVLSVNAFGQGLSILDGGSRYDNDPSIFFSDLSKFDVGENPKGLSVADFNLDGAPDIAVGSLGGEGASPSITLLTGSESNITAVASLAFSSRNLTLSLRGEVVRSGDLTGTGNQSLVISDGGGHFAVLLGHGDGTFEEGTSFAVDGGVTNFELSDLNGDGTLDLVFVSKSGFFGIMQGNGDGSFHDPVRFDAPGADTALALGDLNGDGKPDVAITDRNGNVRTYINAR